MKKCKCIKRDDDSFIQDTILNKTYDYEIVPGPYTNSSVDELVYKNRYKIILNYNGVNVRGSSIILEEEFNKYFRDIEEHRDNQLEQIFGK